MALASRVAAAATVGLSLALGACDGDESPQAAAPAAKPANPNNVPTPPPPMTVDIDKITSDLGSAYQTKADLTAKMAKGTSLDGAQTKQFYDAQATIANTCVEISELLKKTPRWQRTITVALEKNTKKSIIAAAKADSQFKKASAKGRPAGAMPADVSRSVQDGTMARMRVEGLMSYSKAEME